MITERRRAWHRARIDTALTPADRLAAATDYVRAALASNRRTEPPVEIEDLIERMIAAAERIGGTP